MSHSVRALALCLLSGLMCYLPMAAYAQQTGSKPVQKAAAEEDEVPLIKKEGWRTKFSIA